jgi:Rrf2 family protein
MPIGVAGEGIMPLLSRKADYALVILSYLHHHSEGGSARDMALRFGLSRPFVANILKQLAQRGLVRGRRGLGGGYVLARPAQEVCLCELLEALDEPFQLAQCNRQEEGLPCNLEGFCPVREAIAVVHERIRDLLRTVTLADLFRVGGCCAEGEKTATQYGLEVALRQPRGVRDLVRVP